MQKKKKKKVTNTAEDIDQRRLDVVHVAGVNSVCRRVTPGEGSFLRKRSGGEGGKRPNLAGCWGRIINNLFGQRRTFLSEPF